MKKFIPKGKCEYRSVHPYWSDDKSQPAYYECCYGDIDANADIETIQSAWELLSGDRDIWNFAETSLGRLHWRIEFTQGFSRKNKKRHESLQEGLTNFVNSVCNQDGTHPVSDPAVISDANRLLRNFGGYGLRNWKYLDSPLIWLTKARRKAYAGKDLFPLLIQYGYIQKPKKEKKKWYSLASSINKIRKEVRKNGGFLECTRQELAELIDRHVNTVDLCLNILKRNGELGWKLIGNNKAGNQRRCVIFSLNKPAFSGTHKKSIKNRTNAPPDIDLKKISVLKEFEGKAVAKGLRDKFTFAASLELKHLTGGNIEENQAYVFLRKHYDYKDLRSFTEREMRNVIKNALKPQFKFPLSEKKLSEWGLLPAYDRRGELH